MKPKGSPVIAGQLSVVLGLGKSGTMEVWVELMRVSLRQLGGREIGDVALYGATETM